MARKREATTEAEPVLVGTIHGHELFQGGGLLALLAPAVGLWSRTLIVAGFRRVGATEGGRWELRTETPIEDLRARLGPVFGKDLVLEGEARPEAVEFPTYRRGSRVRLVDRNRPTGTVRKVREAEGDAERRRWGAILEVQWDDPKELETVVRSIRIEPYTDPEETTEEDAEDGSYS